METNGFSSEEMDEYGYEQMLLEDHAAGHHNPEGDVDGPNEECPRCYELGWFPIQEDETK